MTTTELLARYENGKTCVSLYIDGTKIREYEGEPLPKYPESMDIKITNWCDAGCAYCHENSVPEGKHARGEDILEIVEGLPKGVELAIGGGDPLMHPQIITILKEFKDRGLVSNITVNGLHVYRHAQFIKNLRKNNLIYGVGISHQSSSYLEEVADSNTIIHFIVGVDQAQDARRILVQHNKILLLGYKNYGRGIKYLNEKVYSNVREWKYWVGTLLKKGIICFDNLAIEQLNLKDILTKDIWDKCYMGDDGKFTMYADAVKNTFAASSTSPRVPRGKLSALTFFQTLGGTDGH